MTLITSANVSLLPLSLQLSVSIFDDIAFFHVTHTFWNHSAKALDRAAFTFPLPTGCAVSDFTCDFGHDGRFRSIASKVKPREAARFAFEQSARAERPTGLLEQNSPEAFTATIGNIAGHGRLRTQLTYFGYLRSMYPRKGSTVRTLTLTIPSSIAKRYGVPPPEFQDSGQPLTPYLTQYDIQVHHGGHAEFRSNQKITTQWSGWTASWLVRYARVRSPPGDFELSITSGHSSDEGQAFFEAADRAMGHQFAMVVTIPPKQAVNTEPRAAQSDIIFIADRSGSMEDKIDALKKAMNVFLKGIPTKRRFNIWCFGSGYHSIWPGCVEYNAATLKVAEDQVSRWSSNMGGTELLQVLEAVDSSLGPTAMADIIVLTDGEVWPLHPVINFVKQRTEAKAGRMRFFALGIGTQVSHGLVEGIAKYGGGYSEVIQGTNPTMYAERLNAMLRAANVKHVNSVEVEVDGTVLSQSTNMLYTSEWIPSPPATLSSPADLSKVGGFTRNRLFLMYDSLSSGTCPQEVRINEVDPYGYKSTTSIPVLLVPNDDGRNLLHKAAARALLGDLEFRESWIQMHPNAPPAGSDEEIRLTRQHGEDLGCTWGLVSKWTSFYVVETASGPSHSGDRFLDGSYNRQTSRSEDSNPMEDQRPKKHSHNNSTRDSSKTATYEKKPSKTTTTTTKTTAADTWAESDNPSSKNPASQHSMSQDDAPETYNTDIPSTDNSNVNGAATGDVLYRDSQGKSSTSRIEHQTTSWQQEFETPSQPNEYLNPALQPDQQDAESPYFTSYDQAPTEPEPIVRDDLSIKVPSFVLCNPPTSSAMLDVSSKGQDKKKEEEKRKYKSEFATAEKLINMMNFDGSFTAKDVRSLLGKDLFDRIVKSLEVLIATIAVLVMLDEERYSICNELLGPLKEKANDFIWNKIGDEGYWNNVLNSERGGYGLEEVSGKQAQTQGGHFSYAQEGDDTHTTTAMAEYGTESAAMGTGDQAAFYEYPVFSDDIYDESNSPQTTSTNPHDIANRSPAAVTATMSNLGPDNRNRHLPPQQMSKTTKRFNHSPTVSSSSHSGPSRTSNHNAKSERAHRSSMSTKLPHRGKTEEHYPQNKRNDETNTKGRKQSRPLSSTLQPPRGHHSSYGEPSSHQSYRTKQDHPEPQDDQYHQQYHDHEQPTQDYTTPPSIYDNGQEKQNHSNGIPYDHEVSAGLPEDEDSESQDYNMPSSSWGYDQRQGNNETGNQGSQGHYQPPEVSNRYDYDQIEDYSPQVIDYSHPPLDNQKEEYNQQQPMEEYDHYY